MDGVLIDWIITGWELYCTEIYIFHIKKKNNDFDIACCIWDIYSSDSVKEWFAWPVRDNLAYDKHIIYDKHHFAMHSLLNYNSRWLCYIVVMLHSHAGKLGGNGVDKIMQQVQVGFVFVIVLTLGWQEDTNNGKPWHSANLGRFRYTLGWQEGTNNHKP